MFSLFPLPSPYSLSPVLPPSLSPIPSPLSPLPFPSPLYPIPSPSSLFPSPCVSPLPSHPVKDSLAVFPVDHTHTPQCDNCPEQQRDLGLIDSCDVWGGQLCGQLTVQEREREDMSVLSIHPHTHTPSHLTQHAPGISPQIHSTR